MKDDRKYLLHILECVTRIEENVRDGPAAFDASHNRARWGDLLQLAGGADVGVC